MDSEANDAAADAFRQHGFRAEDHLPFVQMNRLLPLLPGPIAAHTRDSDRSVREAAVAACIPLIDDARLRHHRTALIPSARQVLAASTQRPYRERAIDASEESGEDTTGLVGRDPSAFIDPDLPRRAPRPGRPVERSEEPPFWDQAFCHRGRRRTTDPATTQAPQPSYDRRPTNRTMRQASRQSTTSRLCHYVREEGRRGHRARRPARPGSAAGLTGRRSPRVPPARAGRVRVPVPL